MKDLLLLLLGLALLLPLVAWAGAPAVTDVAPAGDPRSALRLGNELAAIGRLQEAAHHFSKAALSDDRRLATRAHYNQGTLAARQARDQLGDDPIDASLATRQAGMALLNEALVHYRDAMELDPQFSDARYNWELVRLWIDRTQDLWSQHDRRERRRNLNALEMLVQILAEQRALRARNLAWTAQADAAGRRELARRLAGVQCYLSGEIAALQEKIALALESAPAAWPETLNPVSLSSQGEEGLPDELRDLADDAQREMARAGDLLKQGTLEEALVHQTRSVELLDETRLGLVPFTRLLHDALELQRDLIVQVTSWAEGHDAPKLAALHQAVWDQEFLARWSQLLAVKGEQSRRVWEAMRDDASLSEKMPPAGEDFAPCAEKAVAVAARLQELTDQATVELLAEQPKAALAKQQAALALLEEVWALLPAEARSEVVRPLEPPHSAPEAGGPSPSESQEGEMVLSSPRDPKGASGGRIDSAGFSAELMIRQVRQRQRQRRALEQQFQQQQRESNSVEKDW